MSRNLLIILLFFILVILGVCYYRGHHPTCISCTPSPQDTTLHWISWNLLFTPASLGTSNSTVQAFETYLTNYVQAHDPYASLIFKLKYCPCDSLITNIDAALVAGSGQSISPPPTKPNPGPSGDYLLGNNINMYIPGNLDTAGYDTTNLHKYLVKITTDTNRNSKKLLAVIDTGLDTLLFKKSFPNTVWSGDLLWEDHAKSTIFDVVLGEGTDVLKDSNLVKHGTAATEIALKQIQVHAPQHVPAIMSIRAFDDSERGSIYTVSCALSYAVQHHADYVNASWGYYGWKDSILMSYLFRASNQGMRIIAAAGNTPGTHFRSDVGIDSLNSMNSLDPPRNVDSMLFYPACFAPEIPNVVSVTEIHRAKAGAFPPNTFFPCFYQNYSSKYITVGALDESNKDSCCSFSIPFLASGVEGSSFATPVVTGLLMTKVTDKAVDIKLYIRSNTPTTATPGSTGTTVQTLYTNDGRYIPFIQ